MKDTSTTPGTPTLPAKNEPDASPVLEENSPDTTQATDSNNTLDTSKEAQASNQAALDQADSNNDGDQTDVATITMPRVSQNRASNGLVLPSPAALEPAPPKKYQATRQSETVAIENLSATEPTPPRKYQATLQSATTKKPSPTIPDSTPQPDVSVEEQPRTVIEEHPDTIVEEPSPVNNLETTVEEHPDTIVEEHPDAVLEQQPESVLEQQQPDTVLEERPETVVENQPDAIVEEQPESVLEEQHPDVSVEEQQPDTIVEEPSPINNLETTVEEQPDVAIEQQPELDQPSPVNDQAEDEDAPTQKLRLRVNLAATHIETSTATPVEKPENLSTPVETSTEDEQLAAADTQNMPSDHAMPNQTKIEEEPEVSDKPLAEPDNVETAVAPTPNEIDANAELTPPSETTDQTEQAASNQESDADAPTQKMLPRVNLIATSTEAAPAPTAKAVSTAIITVATLAEAQAEAKTEPATIPAEAQAEVQDEPALIPAEAQAEAKTEPKNSTGVILLPPPSEETLKKLAQATTSTELEQAAGEQKKPEETAQTPETQPGTESGSQPPLPPSKPTGPGKRKWPLWARIALAALAFLLVSSGAAAAYAYYYIDTNLQKPLTRIIHPVSRNQNEPTTIPTPDISNITGRSWNILLLGSDNDNKYTFPAVLTQVMMVVHVDTAHNKVTMLSIPRDSWVNVPNIGGMHKIDQAFFLGANQNNNFDDGVRAARATIERDYGIPIDRYAWVGLEGFAKVIDTLGGVDVDVAHPIMDDAYPDDTGGVNKNDPYALKRLYLTPGPQHLNGLQALEYVRSRHADLVGDIGRTQRQQQVLESLKNKLNVVSIIQNLSQLMSDVSGKVYTDLSEQEMIEFANYGRTILANPIDHVTLGPGTGNANYGDLTSIYDPSAQSNQDVLIPHCNTIQPIVNRIFGLGNRQSCRVNG